MIPALLALAGYVVGATPTSYWVGRGLSGRDLRKEGSGNLGATNTLRVLGWKAALPVLLVDIAKGWVPTALFPLVDGSADPRWALLYGASTIIGHVFSFWVSFRGGKGVATSSGVLLALAPWALLVSFVVWAGAVGSSRMVSLGSILAAAVLPVAVALTPHRAGDATLAFTVGLAVFVIWAHRGNIRRIVRGEENRFGSSRTSGKASPTEDPTGLGEMPGDS